MSLMVVPRLQSEEVYSETPGTPHSSASERMSPPGDIEHSTFSPGLTIERPKSACDEQIKQHHDAWYPRRLSFSIAQDAIETWYPLVYIINPGNTLLKSKQIVSN
jgi:hypothetical protein